MDKDAVPAYLLDREGMSHAKVLSNSIKQKRKEKAGKWSVPIPKVLILAPNHMSPLLQPKVRTRILHIRRT